MLNKKTIALLLCCCGVLVLGAVLLRSDSADYLKWCLMALLFGLGFYPLSSSLFSTFSDRGWIFSKAIGIALAGFLAFVLIATGGAKFTSGFVFICAAALAAACRAAKHFIRKQKKPSLLKKDVDINLILFEELLFLAVFLMWAYFAGFNAQAYGTEKFMDYGFMAAMDRSETLPATDIWYSLKTTNYYYGGQYYAVFLSKITGSDISVVYNLMRAFVASLAFVLPFSIVYHLIKDRAGIRKSGGGAALAGGLVSGAAVSLAGNFHYVLYGLFGSVFKLSGYEDYWFPSSTRYIGHNPATNDMCIHEFPSYSFILGDLHAHVVNVMFVLCFAGLVYAWFKKKKERYNTFGTAAFNIKSVILDPYILLLGVFAGIFGFTNYWDFVIYLTVGIIACILMALRKAESKGALACVIRCAMLIIVSAVSALPFSYTFESPAQGIAVAQNHSALYQLAILWALPLCAVVLLFAFVLRKHVLLRRSGGRAGFISAMSVSDMTALLFGICAVGLVIIPEMIYVRDIYEENYARCNTMFKLTYQAFILFGMAFGYSIFRILSDAKRLVAIIIAWVLLGLFTLTCGYFPYAVSCWYGNVFDISQREGMDATAYLESEFQQDAEAIRWLNENVSGNPVVLEAPGDSYSAYERVSAMTGLPTVIGWYVHEWLWRGDPEDINEKIADVETIYTSDDESRVRELIEEYDIEYIFIGSCEREKYENLNEDMLLSLGDVVFEGTQGENPAYVIRIDV